MLTKEGKKSAIIHSIVLLVWIGLVILASFKDLEISKAIANRHSFYGAIFADIGQWPAYLITPFATTVLFYNVTNMTKKKGGRIALWITFAVLHFLGWFLLFNGIEKLYELPEDIIMLEIPLALSYALIASFPCLYFAKFIDKSLMKRLLKFAVFTIIVLLVTQILVNVLKALWSRARFRDMEKLGTFEMFTPWYHPNGIRKVEGYRLTSFPSGHVNSATNIFVIVVLADILPSLKNKKGWLYAGCGIFVGLTMLSRVVFRAHFLSDTLFGFFVAYLAFYIIKAIFFRGGKFVFEDKKDALDSSKEVVEDQGQVDNIENTETIEG